MARSRLRILEHPQLAPASAAAAALSSCFCTRHTRSAVVFGRAGALGIDVVGYSAYTERSCDLQLASEGWRTLLLYFSLDIAFPAEQHQTTATPLALARALLVPPFVLVS